MKKTIILIALWTGAGCLLQAQPEKKHLREGNKQYGEGKYAESELEYRKALEENSESYKANYNLGGALYKQEKYREAGEQYSAVPGELPPSERARYYHNLGNTFLQNGQLKESIEAYKEALRNRPDDMETKYNLSYALRLLKEQQQQQQQQGQDGKQNQPSGQEKQDRQEQEKKDQGDQEQQQQQQPGEQENRQNPEKSEDRQASDRISKEDAERLLRALAGNEKEIQEKVKKAEAKVAAVKVEKEW